MRWRLLIISDEDPPVRWHELFHDCDVDRVAQPLASAVADRSADLILFAALSRHDDVGPRLRSLRAARPSAPIFAILPTGVDRELIQFAIEATADFAIWPAHTDELEHRVRRILGAPPPDAQAIGSRLATEAALRQLVGRDPAFVRVIEQIPPIARSNRPVLITGETGTGKELCARAIHHLGPRHDYPFIPVDCGAFPDHLFENEMFGHERGAFTDAYRRQRGLVSMAEGGTLFLDEIDSLSPASQAKLLRFLQERTYRPLGGEQFVRAEVHVLAATNRDLDTLVREQRFRQDLFFRLSVLRLHMVPLRERRGDVPLLAQHFLDTIAAEESAARKRLTPIAATDLQERPWPGNVRELYNVVQRAYVFAHGAQILPAHIAMADAHASSVALVGSARDGEGFREARARAIAAFERQYVTELLRAHNGNITQAARCAGQDRRAFGRLVKRHNIKRADLVAPPGRN